MNGKKLHRVLEYTNHLSNVLTVLSDKKSYNSTSERYSSQVVSTSDYYPFGWAMPQRQYDSGRYRFGFNSQEKSDIAEGHTTAQFWEYSSRTARRWNRDPVIIIGISSYSVLDNSPVMNVDLLGDSLIASSESVIPSGSTESRGERLLTALKETFPGDQSKELRGLFRLQNDGKAIAKIDEDDFIKAVANLSEDEQSLAYFYYRIINAKTRYIVDLVRRTEAVSSETKGEFKSNWPVMVVDHAKGGINTHILDVQKDSKGKVTAVKLTANLSVVAMNPGNTPSDYVNQSGQKVPYNESYRAVVAHELGHGLGRLTLSKTYSHEDAIRMTNLYSRVHGLDYYRDGSTHGPMVKLSKAQANQIPAFAKMPKAMMAKIKKMKNP